MTLPGQQDSGCRRILIASPIEPSGASWLLNCFLELGIRIDHKPVVDRIWRGSTPAADADRMWIIRNDRSLVLNPKLGVLMKFLPALAHRPAFYFRDDVRVEYVQNFPCRQPDGDARVLVVRDPQDAIYSAYRRSAPAQSFAEFLHFPNPATLLDRAAHWALFVAAWMALPPIHVVRFEDYKQDAQATLRSVLLAIGLTCTDRDIENAVRLSSFEQARDTERAVRDRFPADRQLANRSGTVGEASSHPEVVASLPDIEAAAAPVLRRLGYAARAPAAAGDGFAKARLCAAFLGFFTTIHLPEEVASAPLDMEASAEVLFGLLAFTQRLDAERLGRAGMSPAEARALLDSLAEFTRGYAAWLADGLASTRSSFSDGSHYFFERIRSMRQSGRTRPGAD